MKLTGVGYVLFAYSKTLGPSLNLLPGNVRFSLMEWKVLYELQAERPRRPSLKPPAKHGTTGQRPRHKETG